MEWAKLLMTLKEQSDKAAAVQTTEVATLKDQVSMLTEQVATLPTKRNGTWKCGVLLVLPTRPHAKILSSSKKILCLWTTWTFS